MLQIGVVDSHLKSPRLRSTPRHADDRQAPRQRAHLKSDRLRSTKDLPPFLLGSLFKPDDAIRSLNWFEGKRTELPWKVEPPSRAALGQSLLGPHRLGSWGGDLAGDTLETSPLITPTLQLKADGATSVLCRLYPTTIPARRIADDEIKEDREKVPHKRSKADDKDKTPLASQGASHCAGYHPGDHPDDDIMTRPIQGVQPC